MNSSQRVLITGTSTGIGRELAFQFAAKGFDVIATARNIDSIADFGSSNITPFKLDVTKESDILELTEYLNTNDLVINILINNAGFGLMGPAAETPVEMYMKVLETNFFAQINLTQKLLKFIPKTPESRIVNIGSISGVLTTPFASPYCSSKAAFNSFSDGLRMELKPFGIKVLSVQPGAITSNFGKNASSNTKIVLENTSIYKPYEDKILNRATTSQDNAMPVEAFAAKLIGKITSGNPPAMIRLGKFSFVGPFIKKCLPEKFLDKILTKVFGF
jgi:short-subunit dehydrogenase